MKMKKSPRRLASPCVLALSQTLFALLASIGGVNVAAAAGFQLLEQNASGLGNAYAGSAAVAENASTIFFNPAGMTQLPARSFSLGAVAIDADYRFIDNGSATGSLSGNGLQSHDLAVLPNTYLAWAVQPDLYLGIGVSAPFGLKTEYSSPWTGAAQSTAFSVNTLNVNPSLAYRVNEAFSFGFGLDWQKLDAEYTRTVGLSAGSTSSVQAKTKLSGTALGWNAGALFTLSPMTKVGIAYRSALKFKTSGLVGLSNDGTAGGIATMNALNALGVSSDVRAELELPSIFILSVSQKLSEQWTMLGDLSRTAWSSIPYVNIVHSSGVADGTTLQTLDTRFRNTWRIALGSTYTVNDAWKAKFGLAYDQTPVPNANYRMTSLPDNNRFWLSVGGQWKPSKESAIDFGLARLFFKESSINNDQTSGETIPRGVVNGTYRDSAWLFGGQYSLSY